jgi:uncharacterized protein YndB with AHSA1/START domain
MVECALSATLANRTGTRVNRAVSCGVSGMASRASWVILLLLCAPLAQAEVKDSAAAGFTVENAREVPVDAAIAWKALVEDVDRWWPKDHSWWGTESVLRIEPNAGGCFCERATDGKRAALHMTVTYVEPGKLLRMTGGLGPLQGMGLHGALEWRFSESGGKTKIVMWYRAGGYTPDDVGKLAPVVDRVQAQQLGALADYLQAPATKQQAKSP